MSVATETDTVESATAVDGRFGWVDGSLVTFCLSSLAVAVNRAVDLVGHLRDAAVGTLSGGQKQLAWIAMVLAQEPDVHLLDEPTPFLDLRHQLRVLETVRSLNPNYGVTVGIVLHDVAQAARFADNLVALADGEPYAWGPPREVVTEELLAEVFDVDATVREGPSTVTPYARRSTLPTAESTESRASNPSNPERSCVSSPATGFPKSSAWATSESVPVDPPTAITASPFSTTRTLRALPIPVAMAVST